MYLDPHRDLSMSDPEDLISRIRDSERLNSTEYEELVATILEHKARKITGYHNVRHDKQLKLKSGEKQMDVLLDIEDGNEQTEIIIECKGQSETIGKDLVAAFAFYVDRSSADQGLFVSKSGFSSGATEIALEEPIQLLKLTDISDDLPNSIDYQIQINYPESILQVWFFPPDTDSDEWTRLRRFIPEEPDRRECKLYGSEGEYTGKTIEEWLLDLNYPRSDFEDGQMIKVNREFCPLVHARIK